MSKPISEQIDDMERQMRSHRMFVENALTAAFAHVKAFSTNGLQPRDVAMQIMNDMMEIVRLSTIMIMLDMLTHPQRFEMFTQLACNLKEQEKDI